VGVQPTRVLRLRARRARRRAIAAGCAVAGLMAFLPQAVTALEAMAVAPSPGPEARPSLQGSPAARELSPSSARANHDAAAQMALAASSFRVVERVPGVGVWVAARRGLGALGALKAAAEAAPSAIPAGWLTLHKAVAVTVVVKGKDHDVITNAATVGQLLSAMGIEPDGNDRIAPPSQTPLPHVRHPIRFRSVDVRRVTLTQSIPFAVHTTVTHAIPPGQTRITVAGVDGLAQRTYRITVVDDAVESRVLVSQQVLRAAVTEERQEGARTVAPPSPPGAHVRYGDATWYRTGHPGLTAASPWLPFGTKVTVTNLANGRSVTVVINDRGPFGGRIIDLSPDAFRLLAPLPSGVFHCKLAW
jgi:rare lipoprotein A